MTITRDDWLAALKEVDALEFQQDYPDAVTPEEFSQLMERSVGWANRYLKLLCAKGKAVKVTKWVKDTIGRHYRQTAFQLKKDGELHDPSDPGTRVHPLSEVSGGKRRPQNRGVARD